MGTTRDAESDPAEVEPVNYDADGKRLPGYSVLGRRESEREVRRLVWQPTQAAAEVSRARLLAEGHVQLDMVPGIADGPQEPRAAA